MKKLSVICCALLGALMVIAASAESLKEPQNQEPNRLLLDVDGIVCSFCSHGVKKKLSKLPFIDKSQYNDGIYVDIEQQQVLVAIKPDAKVDVQAAFKAVREGGYDPLRACVTDSTGKLDCIDAEKES